MRRWIFAILVTILTLTLCVNFARFVVFTSSHPEEYEVFDVLDPFEILDAFNGLNVSTDELFLDLSNTLESIGNAGSKFASAFNPSTNITGTFFDKVIGFFQGLFDGVVGFIEFIASVINSGITFIVWQFDLVRALFNLLNTLLGTAY